MVSVRDLRRIFGKGTGGGEVRAVDGLTFDIPRGRMTAVVGPSGAGKTTLLNLIAGLDVPTEGSVTVDGQDVTRLSEAAKVALRRDRLSFVFQNFGLLPLLTASENVSVPLRIRQMSRAEREQRVVEALEWVGLRQRASHRPHELSGGEQQRVALARALAAQPALLLADEPTGQLDSQTGKRVIGVMRRLVDELGITLVVVTHDAQVRDAADLVLQMRSGKLLSPEPAGESA
jgi:putative ABC transport system ATP-binding protein